MTTIVILVFLAYTAWGVEVISDRLDIVIELLKEEDAEDTEGE